MPASIAELSWIETADGEIYDFNDSGTRFALTAPLNGGLPDQRFFTRLPYLGDREIETDDPRLNPRTFSIVIRNKQTNRDDFWLARTELLDAVRPNRGGQPLFVFRFPDESERAIYVRPQSPVFDDDDPELWSEFSFEETMVFQAFDPVWFDPTATIEAVTQVTADELVFPITFDNDNIVFDNQSLYGSVSITYEGNWYSYPTFTINGPCDSVTINHIELGLVINYNQALTSSEQIVLNLNDRLFTKGSNNIVLHPISNIVDFRIEPTPVVLNGVNTFEIFLPNSDGNSSVEVSYNTRYIGI